MNHEYHPEILSPAGTLDCLKAACASGADAVYFGGQMFNARKNAGSFDSGQIAEAVRLCRLYGVRTHLTVNTSIKEQEWPQLCAFLEETLPLGVDAVIVQDPGVASYIAEHFPQTELHASTQMAVSSLDGVRWMQELGFQRVVLARELSLSEIEFIRSRTDMQLEVFIHGALCYSYSGRCLLSSFHGGRSGNRGACAQPCRMEYTCSLPPLGEKTGYLMNLKDREGFSVFQNLLDLGIDSFKIEGRMKSEAYVAGITRFYHELKEEYLTSGRISEPAPERIEELMQLFNRGEFTNGYFLKKEGMIEPDHPKNQGLLIGRVTAADKGKIRIRSDKELHPGDELEIQEPAGRRQTLASLRLAGTMIENPQEASFYLKEGSRISRGFLVRRVVDPVLQKKITDQAEIFPPIPLRVEGRAVPGETSRWKASASGITMETEGPEPLKALNRPSDPASVRKQWERLGDTPFFLESFSVDLGDQVFLPASMLNQIRRDLTDRMKEALESRRFGKGGDGKLYHPLEKELSSPEEALRLEIGAENEAQLSAAFDYMKTLPHVKVCWYLSLEGWMDKDKAAILGQTGTENLVIRLPLKTLDRELSLIEQEIRDWQNLGVSLFEAALPGHVGLIRRLGGRVCAGPDMGVWNRKAAKTLLGECERITMSREITLREIRDLKCPGGTGLVIYGRIPYMITEQCPVRECFSCRKKNDHYQLADRRKEKIRGVCHCSLCYNVLYSEKPASISLTPGYLTRVLTKREKRPAEALRLELTDESERETVRVLEFFFREDFREIPDLGEGHFRKEVM